MSLQQDSQISTNSNISGDKKMSRTGIVLVALSGGAAVALSAICLPFVTPAIRRVCLPYVPATHQQLENVTRALMLPTVAAAAPRKLQTQRLLVDLGSGDGRVVERASREGIKSIGVELNLWLVLYSRARAFFTGITPRPTYKRVNLWKYSLADFTDVVIFGVGPMMSELESKFTQELQDGCTVVACRFPLPTWKPIATFGSGVDTVWLYVMNSDIKRIQE
ncbi:hypothetical protein B566_EDAN006767 [Ephemera danica]|nr:hypothetical protein B566_EDAN006767 [Ephemera danica]